MQTILSLVAAFTLSMMSIGAATVDLDATVAGTAATTVTIA